MFRVTICGGMMEEDFEYKMETPDWFIDAIGVSVLSVVLCGFVVLFTL